MASKPPRRPRVSRAERHARVFDAADTMVAQAASISARVGSVRVPKLASLLSEDKKRDLASKFESPGAAAKQQAHAPSSDPRLSQGTLHVEFTSADVNDLCATYMRYNAVNKPQRGLASAPSALDAHSGEDAASLSLAQSSADLVVVASMGTTAGHILPGLFDSDDFFASSRDAAEAMSPGGADAFLPASVAAQTTYEHLMRTGARCLIKDQVQQHTEEHDTSQQKRFWGAGSDDDASVAAEQEGTGLSVQRASASPGAAELPQKPPAELTDVIKHNASVFAAPAYVGLHKRSAARVVRRQARLVNGETDGDAGIHSMTAGGFQVPHELPSGRMADVCVSNVYHGTRAPAWRWAAALPVYACSPDTVMHVSVLRIADAISTSATNQQASLEDFMRRVHLVGACVFPLGTLLGGGASALAHHGNVLANPMQTARDMEANAGEWEEALSGQGALSADLSPPAVALASSLLLRPLSPLSAAFAYWNQLWTTSLAHESLPVHVAPPVNSVVFGGSVFDFPSAATGPFCPPTVLSAALEGSPLQLLRSSRTDASTADASSTKAPPKATVDQALVAQVLCMLLRAGHVQVLPPAPISAARTLSSGMPTPRPSKPSGSAHDHSVVQRPKAVEISPQLNVGHSRPDFAIASLQLHAAVGDLAPASVGQIKREVPRGLHGRLQRPDSLLVVSFPPEEAAEQLQRQLASVPNPLTTALAKAEIRNSTSTGALPLAEAAGISEDAVSTGRDLSSASVPLSPANSVHSRQSQGRHGKQGLAPLNTPVGGDRGMPQPLPSTRTWTSAAGGQHATRQHDWLRDKEHSLIVQQPFHGVPAYVLNIRWRFEVDEDPAAVRGARLLQRIGVSHGDPLSTLKVQPLRLLAHAAESSKSTEISRHLPVLEPLFRHVTEELERRRHADWGVMAEASSQLYASVLRQDAAGTIPRVVSTPVSARRAGSAAYTVRGGGSRTAGFEFSGGARESGRRPALQAATHHAPMTPRARHESVNSADAPAIAPAGMGTLQMLLPAGCLHAAILGHGGARRSATRTDEATSSKLGASSVKDGASSISGIRKFEFVGLMRQLTELNVETLNSVFDHMDSNNDDDLSFDEFISYLLAEADTALAHRLSQDCYLLSPPAIRDTHNCVRVDNGGAQRMEKMPEMQGYAVLFSDNQMQVWDDSFSLALHVDVRASTCPLPPAYCLPLTEMPAHTGLMVSFDKTTGKLQTVRQAEGVSSSTVQRGGASQRDTLDAQDRFRSDLRAQRSVMGVVIDAGSVDTRGRYRRSSMSGQYLRDALASAGGRAALTAPIRPGTADAGQLSTLRSTVPAHLFNTYYKPAHEQGQTWASPLGFSAAEAFANPVTVDAASRIVARGQHSASDAKQQAKQMLAFMSNTGGPIAAARPQTAATALKKNRKGGAGMGKLRGRLHASASASEDESAGSQSAGGVTFSAATEDVLANMTPPITAVAFDGTGGRRVLLVACADRMVRVFDLGKYRSDGPLPLKEVVRRRRQAANKKKSLRAKVRAGMGADTVNIKASSLAALPGMEDILDRAAVRAQTGKDASEDDVRAAAMARAATVAAAITSTAPGVQPSDALVAQLLGGNPEAYLTTPTSRLRHAAAMVEPMASLQRTEALVSVVFGGSRLQDVARREALMGSADPARSLIPLPGASNATIGNVPSELYHHNPYMGARLRRRAARRKQQTALQEASSAAAAAANTLQEASPLSAPVSIRTGAGLHGALGAEEAARTASMHLKSAAAAESTHARSHKGATIISNAHMSTSSMLDGGRETAISALAATYVTGGLMNSAMGGADGFLANAGGMSASALAITNAIQREQQAARSGAGRGGALSGSAMTMMASGRSKGDKLKSGFIGVGTELSQGLSANVVLSSDLRSGGTLKDGSAATSGAITMPVVGGQEAGVSTLTCFSSFGVGPGIPQCMCVLQCVPYITEADHGDHAGPTEGADLGQRSGTRGADDMPQWQSATSMTQETESASSKNSKRARKGGFGHVVQDGVPTGTLYAVGDSAGFVGLYSTKTFVRVALIPTTLESVTCLLQAPGVGLLAAGLGGPMCVIDVLAGAVRDWDGKPSNKGPSSKRGSSRINAPADRCMSVGIRSMTWCDTERCIISVGHDRRVLVWDPDLLETGPAAEIGAVPHSVSPADTVVSVAVNDAHRQIVTLTAGGRVQVWDPRTLRCLQSESDAVGRSHTGLRSQAQEALNSVQDMALGTTMGDIMGGDITGNNTALGQTMSGESSSAATAGITHANNGDVSIGTSAVAKIAAATAGSADSKHAPGSYLLRGAYDPGTGGGYFGAGIMVDLLRLSVVVYGSHARAWKVVEVDGNETPAAVAAARFFGLQEEAGEAMAGEREEGGRSMQSTIVEHSASASSTLAGRVLPDGTVRLTTASGLHEGDLGAALADTLGGPGSAHMGEGAADENAAVNSKVLANVRAERKAAEDRVTNGYDAEDIWMATLYAKQFNLVVAVKSNGRVVVWDVRSGAVQLTFRAHHGRVAKDATRLISKSDANGLGGSADLSAACLDAAGRRLVTASITGTVRLWNITNGALVRSLVPHNHELSCVAFHPAASVSSPIVAGAWNGTLLWWEDDGTLNEDVSSDDEGGGDASAHTSSLSRWSAGEAGAKAGGRRRKINKYLRYRTEGEDEDAAVDALTAATMARIPGHEGVGADVDAALDLAASAGVAGADTMRPDSAKLKASLKKHQLRAEGTSEELKQLLGKAAEAGERAAAGGKNKNTTMNKEAKLMLAYFKGSGASPSTFATGGSSMQAAGGEHSTSLSTSKALTQVGRRSNTEALQAAASVSQRMRTSLLLTLSSHERKRRVDRARSDAPPGFDAQEESGDLLKAGSTRSAQLRKQIKYNNIIAPGKSSLVTQAAGRSGVGGGAHEGVNSGPRTTQVPLRTSGLQGEDSSSQHRESSLDEIGGMSDPQQAGSHSVSFALSEVGSAASLGMSEGGAGSASIGASSASSAIKSRSTSLPRKQADAPQFKMPTNVDAGAYSSADILCVCVGGGGSGPDGLSAVDAASDAGPAWVATGSADGQLVIWNPNTFKPSLTHKLSDLSPLGAPEPSPITGLLPLVHMNAIVVGTASGCLHLLNLASGRMRNKPRLAGAKSAATKRRVTVTDDGRVQVIAAKKEVPLTSFHTTPLTDEWDSGVSVFSQTAAQRGAESKHSGNVGDAASSAQRGFHAVRAVCSLACVQSPEGKAVLAVGYDGGHMRLFDISRIQTDPLKALTQPFKEWKPHVHSVSSIASIQPSGVPPLLLSSGALNVKLHRVDGSLLTTFSSDQGQSSSGSHNAPARWPRVLRESDTAAQEIASAVRRLGMLGGAGSPGAGSPKEKRSAKQVASNKVRLLTGAVRRMSMTAMSPGGGSKAAEGPSSPAGATAAHDVSTLGVNTAATSPASSKQDRTDLAKWFEQKVDDDVRGVSARRSENSDLQASPIRASGAKRSPAQRKGSPRSGNFVFDRSMLQSRRHWTREQARSDAGSKTSDAKGTSPGAESRGGAKPDKGRPDAAFWERIEDMESEMVIPPPSRPRTVTQGLVSDRFDVDTLSTAKADSMEVWSTAMHGTGSDSADATAAVRPTAGDSVLFDPSIDLVGGSAQLKGLKSDQRLPLPNLQDLSSSLGVSLNEEHSAGTGARAATPQMRQGPSAPASRKGKRSMSGARSARRATSKQMPKKPSGSASARAGRSTRKRLAPVRPSTSAGAEQPSEPGVPVALPAAAWDAAERSASDRPQVLAPGFGDSTDNIAYEGEFVSSVTNFSQWSGQPGAPIVPKHARIPYEYLGKNRWRRLPINSARNTEGWGALRSQLQNQERMRSELGLRNK